MTSDTPDILAEIKAAESEAEDTAMAVASRAAPDKAAIPATATAIVPTARKTMVGAGMRFGGCSAK